MDVAILAPILFGLVLLVLGAELLVRGAVGVAMAAGISRLVTGLTIVAVATGSPELAVGIQAAFSGEADISVGNVVGSNLFNLLAVLGLVSLVSPIIVSRQLVRFDVPVMIGATVALYLLALDGDLSRVDALLLLSGFVFYTVMAVRLGRRAHAKGEPNAAERPSWRHPTMLAFLARHLAQMAAGVGLLVWGARLVVSGATLFARALGVSDLLIGLTIVAVGTSLPELTTDMMANLRGKGDIAVGDCVGSSIVNVLLVLGLSGLIAPAGLPVSSVALGFDIPLALAVAVICLPIFFRGFEIHRLEGALLLLYYMAYMVYRAGAAVGFHALPTFTTIMLYFVLPVSVATVATLAARYAWGLRRAPAP